MTEFKKIGKIFFHLLLGGMFAVSVVPENLVAQKLKRIGIIAQDNALLNSSWERMHFPDSINTPEYSALKKYVLENAGIKSQSEPAFFFEMMAWVSSRWPHDGWNKAPDTFTSLDILRKAEEGEKYRCVEYGKVLKDILLAFGYISRSVGLKSPDVAYGGAGMGHVATEVWSDRLGKWIFLDPQFNVFARYVNTPLNIYEIYYMKKDGRLDEVDFITIENGKETKNEEYKSFLTRYLGYMDIPVKIGGKNFSLTLKMEGKSDYLTFQAFPSGNNIFTDNEEDLYFELNRTMVLVDFTEDELKRVDSLYRKCEIRTIEDFNEKMAVFAAKPDLKLTLLNNMPWFDRYEVFLNGKTVPVKGDICRVSLPEGRSELKVYGVNKAGIHGPPTTIVFSFSAESP